jgi:putative Ca2+/H+ antiporter (TMEM165/GDT1 family)
MAAAAWQAFLTVFLTVFLAEIGDKTQLATLLFSAKGETSKWVVFAGSASALVLAAGIGVLVGGALERIVSPATLKIVAGLGFIAVGVWTLVAK